MLTHHQLHLLVVVSNSTNLACQNQGPLLGTHLLELFVLQEECQCVFNRPLFFGLEIVLDLDAIVGQARDALVSINTTATADFTVLYTAL